MVPIFDDWYILKIKNKIRKKNAIDEISLNFLFFLLIFETLFL